MICFKSVRLILSLSLIFIGVIAFTQKLSTEDYIEMYKDLAIDEMQKYKIPASIILAQGILESGNGNSRLAVRGKNHFGIKCHKGWTGKTIRWDDDTRRECFRRYNSVNDSYRDHSIFLASRNRYLELFNLQITDYNSWAKGLQNAGYATNNNYSRLLTRIIEDNKLHEFDNAYLISIAANTTTDQKKIATPNSSDFDPIDISGAKRQVFTNNDVKFIFAEAGDSFQKIANDLGIYTWQVYKFNELKKTDTVLEGQMLYIQKKKTKSNIKSHIAKETETMYSISQLYGIRLKSLFRKNKMKEGDQPSVGQIIKLR